MATPARDDFYARGVDIGQAPMEGYDTAQSRDYLAQDRSATLAGKAASTRNTNASAAESEFKLGRQQKSSAAADAAAEAFKAQDPDAWNAPGVGNSATATPGAPSGTGVDASLGGMGSGGAGGGGAAPGAAAKPALSEPLQRAQVRKLQAYAEMVSGEFEKANKLNAEALSATQEHIFNQGAALGSNAAAWDKAAKLISAKDPSITISTDKNGAQRINIVQPDGTATNKLLTETDKRNMMGAQALLEAGHVTAALGILAKVDTNLATEIHYRNELATKGVEANNKGYGEVVGANAHMLHAGAAMKSAEAHMLGAKLGGKYEYQDEGGGLHIGVPSVTKAGGVSFTEAPLPAGARPLAKGSGGEQAAYKPGELVTDKQNGEGLFRVGTDGQQLPADENPLGKDDKKVQSQLASLKEEGIQQTWGKAPGSKKVMWAFNSEKLPGQYFKTPEEIRAALGPQRVLQGPNNALGAQGGRGLTMPGAPPPNYTPNEGQPEEYVNRPL